MWWTSLIIRAPVSYLPIDPLPLRLASVRMRRSAYTLTVVALVINRWQKMIMRQDHTLLLPPK